MDGKSCEEFLFLKSRDRKENLAGGLKEASEANKGAEKKMKEIANNGEPEWMNEINVFVSSKQYAMAGGGRRLDEEERAKTASAVDLGIPLSGAGGRTKQF